jgi:putative transport protein
MTLLGGVISISNTYTFFLVLFAVLLFGYLIGRITIKGVSLGDAGVFIIALFFGALFFNMNEAGELLFAASSKPYDFSAGLTIVEALGLILFVTSVGYIAGPKFFGNFKRNFKSYVLLGIVIILVGGLSAIGCILAGDAIGYGSSIETRDGFVAMIVGLLSGSLTSTPAFSAAKATVAPEYTGLVSVGHGIAYIFGVVGVVLFV